MSTKRNERLKSLYFSERIQRQSLNGMNLSAEVILSWTG